MNLHRSGKFTVKAAQYTVYPTGTSQTLPVNLDKANCDNEQPPQYQKAALGDIYWWSWRHEGHNTEKSHQLQRNSWKIWWKISWTNEQTWHHIAEDLEVFVHLDLGLTKEYEGVTKIMRDDQHLKYNIIVEGQPIEEIVL